MRPSAVGPVARLGVVASVQPRGFIPPAIAERLGLSRASAVTTYDAIAHLGACGPVFNLARARTDERRAGRSWRCTAKARASREPPRSSKS